MKQLPSVRKYSVANISAHWEKKWQAPNARLSVKKIQPSLGLAQSNIPQSKPTKQVCTERFIKEFIDLDGI